MREMMLKLQEAALKAIRESEDAESLEALRVRYLGKKGELTGILRQMGKLSTEER
ncbi:MAG: phenylalanine--tRNA ligase subunit alpha, partial [Oscillospiraceae bacterium]|nr:phenylalanine--tRNA ligase subunit alpha [Oscillospiraceae bacterium]